MSERPVMTTCPTATIAAPIERVWSLLIEPREWTRWSRTRFESADPAGTMRAGQRIRLSAGALGVRLSIHLSVIGVAPEERSIDLDVRTPIGILNHEHMTVRSVDARSTYVAFG